MPDATTTSPESAAAAGVLSGAGDAGNLPLTPNAAAPSQPMAPAAPAQDEHSRVGQIFHGILSTLAPPATEPSIDASGKITEQPVHRTGGEWARRLIAGALTGAASGAAAPARPGAGPLAGLGAGFEGETRALQAQDEAKRAHLQQNFENQEKQKTQATEDQLRQAQTAYYTTQNASLGFEMARQKAKASEDALNSFNAFEKTVGASPDNADLGVFPDMNAVLAYRKEHPELVQQIGGNHSSGQILAVPNLAQGEDGNWVYQGVHAAIVHPDMMDRSAEEYFGGADKIPPVSYFIPGKMGKDGKMEPGTWGTFQPAPGTPVKDLLPWVMKGNADAAKDSLQMTQIAAATEHEKQATTGEELSNQIKERELSGAGAVDELGKPLPALDPDPEKSIKMRETRRTAFDKDYVKDANQLEQSYKQMESILDRARAGKMTGADSVVGLFNAIGISSAPLKGRGFRINSNIVGEHAGARNIWQGMAANLSKLTPNGSGEVVTPAQLQSYQTILAQARHDLYVTMAKEAERQGLAKDFLPRSTANGAAIDPGTMRIFLDSYGGSIPDAAAAAGKFGWGPPAAPAGQTVQ
ncbi:MAG TPA: hypothetical protein VNU44_14600 [Bryobacteraceae bacterium]|jgi:hypothetical protein|nr:hypothetical protein [Bryobacteraceae bacterium]